MATTQIIGPNVVTNVNNKNSGSDIDTFIQFLQSPDTQIPLESNFLIIFNTIPGVFSSNAPNFSELGFENNWDIDTSIKTLWNLIKSNSNTSLAGQVCLWAQGFNVPGEQVEVNRSSSVIGGPSGGLLAGITAGARSQYGAIGLVLLETNRSFIDFVMRPWIALVSHYGLTNRASGSTQNVKTSITGVLFDKNNNNAIRKVYTFNGAAPVGLGQTIYVYGDDKIRTTEIQFVFNTYKIQDVEGSEQ